MAFELPNALEGHWHTNEGCDMAQTYTDKVRSELALGHMTDTALANRVYMLDAPGKILVVTAAKDRIRWLSVQLAIANTQRDRLAAALNKINKDIYSLGALLGSDCYFDIRKTSIDTLRDCGLPIEDVS